MANEILAFASVRYPHEDQTPFQAGGQRLPSWSWIEQLSDTKDCGRTLLTCCEVLSNHERHRRR